MDTDIVSYLLIEVMNHNTLHGDAPITPKVLMTMLSNVQDKLDDGYKSVEFEDLLTQKKITLRVNKKSL